MHEIRVRQWRTLALCQTLGKSQVMISARGHSKHKRDILALSFEPTEDGFLYYHRRWSRGVPVSAEEREAYLSIPALGSRRGWRKAIAGRPTAAPRAFRPVQRKLLASLPIGMSAMSVLIGLLIALSGLAALQTFGGLARAVGGLLFVIFGAQIAFAKFMEARAS
jgi:hypothetical protein